MDHLADRQPFAEFAHRIFALAEAQTIQVYVSALSFCNLYYLLRKLRGHEATITLLARLIKLVHLTPIADREIQSALGSGRRDFEDAVQLASAEATGLVEVIVTRNPQDFVGGGFLVQSPQEFLAALAQGNTE